MNAAKPTLETMMRIAHLLEVEMNDLVRFDGLSKPVEETEKNPRANDSTILDKCISCDSDSCSQRYGYLCARR